MDRSNITKKQHYFPQVYLRGFSEDKKFVWSYVIDPMEKGKYVPIESLCRENYLYEIKDETGKLIKPNWIEKVLSELERMYADNLGRMERKAFLKENYLIKCFLTKQEMSFWRVFVAIQMMRDPEILKGAIGAVKETSKGYLTDNQIRTFAVSQCLPLFEEFEADAPNVFNFFRKPLHNMSIVIGVDESGTLFTSDNPVFCCSSQKGYYVQEENISPIDEYEQIILPLTSNLVLLMFGKEWKKVYGRNCLISLDHELLENIKLTIAYSARNRIITKKIFSENEIKLISKARSDKFRDEAEKR